MSPELLPPKEKTSLEIIQKATTIRDNHTETRLLWKKNEPVLPYNQILALKQYQSLEKKFHKTQTLPISIANKLMNIYRLGMHAN